MSHERKKSKLIEKHALESIPDSERKHWISIAMIWIGAIISVSSLMVGGVLVSGLSLLHAILAGLTGYGIVVLYMTFQGIQGADLGRPTVASASSAFGKKGASFIISFIIGVSVMGWFGVQTSITGSAFSSIMKDWIGINIPVQLSSALWGIIMLTTAIYGYKALAYLNYVAVPSLFILSLYGIVTVISKFGLSTLFNYTPSTSLSFWQGVAITVGGFAVGGVIAPDYSRYARDRKGAILSSLFGVLPMGIFLLIAGALMSIMAGTADMTSVVSSLGFPFIGLLILILATWTTNAVNAYSAGIAITSMFQLKDEKRAMATAIAGLIGTLLAVFGIMNHFVPFLIILTSGISPIAGVMIADYWIKLKGNKEQWREREGIHWIGVIAWISGFIVGYFITFGSAPINAIITAMIVNVVLDKIFIKTSQNPEIVNTTQEQ
jgi:cytosine permease